MRFKKWAPGSYRVYDEDGYLLGDVIYDGAQWRAFKDGLEIRPNLTPRTRKEAAELLERLSDLVLYQSARVVHGVADPEDDS